MPAVRVSSGGPCSAMMSIPNTFVAMPSSSTNGSSARAPVDGLEHVIRDGDVDRACDRPGLREHELMAQTDVPAERHRGADDAPGCRDDGQAPTPP